MTTFEPVQPAFTPLAPHTHVAPVSDLATHQGEDVICLHNVSFAYDSRAVLRNVTLHVKQGQTLGIIGPNGGGKSTLLKLMLGLLKPHAGDVTVLGLPPAQACANGSLVGYVAQRHAIDWAFPIAVKQVVLLGLIGKKRRFLPFSREQKNAVSEALAAVDMLQWADRPIGGLSGGQQQRVFIARALVNRPRILFLDEPTTGIDQSGQEKFAGLLDSLRRRFGLTIVMVSHDIRSVMGTCDRVACLSQTLHYHDHPQGLSRDVLFKVFQCDLDAVLDQHSTLHDGACCHGHPHHAPAPLAPAGHQHPGKCDHNH